MQIALHSMKQNKPSNKTHRDARLKNQGVTNKHAQLDVTLNA